MNKVCPLVILAAFVCAVIYVSRKRRVKVEFEVEIEPREGDHPAPMEAAD